MHTKGPWKLDDATILDSEEERCINVYGSEGQGYGRVAVVYAECGRYNDLLPNARLIAAAPELLEALEGLLPYAKGNYEAEIKAVEAIRKATAT